MSKIIETQRLIMRPLVLIDFNFLRILHSDPLVMKYISSGNTRSEAETRISMDKSFSIEKENPALGAWIVSSNETNLSVGTLIMRKPATDEVTEGYEIGFSFAVEHWGKGYATEASRGIIEYAYKLFGKVRLVALIEPTNKSSRNTLSKLGFKVVGSTQYIDPLTGASLPTEILELLN